MLGTPNILVTTRQLFLICLLAALSSACSHNPRISETPSARTNQTTASAARKSALQAPGYQAAKIATGLIGSPYRYGGKSPAGFDCSGLVYFSYAQIGVSLPRTSRDQYKYATPISLKRAQAGDLLFFQQGPRISHVAIYLGDGRFVHAPSTGGRVSIANLDDGHYRRIFVGAGRINPGV